MIRRKGNLNKLLTYWFLPFLSGGCVSIGYFITHRAFMELSINNTSAMKTLSRTDDIPAEKLRNSKSNQTLENIEKTESLNNQSVSLEQPSHVNSKDSKRKIVRENEQHSMNQYDAGTLGKKSNSKLSKAEINSPQRLPAQGSNKKFLIDPNPIKKIVQPIQNPQISKADEKIFKKLFQTLPKPQ